ncbi:protein XNDC1N [Mantella aurantiaca]
MAPIRIQHVVSFSSQDPRHPVDNLLSDDIQPWLSCPRDRSRQLKVELQLERANHIAYIDVGNSGSAFFQIDVGRSSWSADKPFVPLLPTATLMTPADSKLEKNVSGVRMFKEGDFLEETAGEKWDRLRITCSQPFNKQAQYGLSFLRLRSALEEEDPNSTPATHPHPEKAPPLSDVLPGMKAEDMNNRDHIEERIKQRLQQVMSPPSPRTPNLSRTVRMVLSATQSRKRCHPAPSPASPPANLHPGEGGESPVSSGSCPETSVTPSKPSPKDIGSSSRRGRRTAGRARGRGRRRSGNSPRREDDRQIPAQLPTDIGCCPICTGYFPARLLPAHASSCGEDYQPSNSILSLSDDDSSWDGMQVIGEVPESWVTCPLCGFRFRGSEIERHASTCGE